MKHTEVDRSSSSFPSHAGYFLLDLAGLYFSKQVSRSAAALTYYLVLTFFPAIICLNAIIGSLRLNVSALLDQVSLLIPSGALEMLRDYLAYVSTNQSRALLALGLVTMLSFASAAMRTMMLAIGELYGRSAYRGIWAIVSSVVFSALLLATFYLSLVVIVTGEWFFRGIEGFLRRLPGLDAFSMPWNWQWLRFPILFALLLLFILLVYRAAAPKHPAPPVLNGAFLASAALVAASAAFSHFIGLSSRYSLVYGSLASVVILLLWLYLCGNIIIFGACFNRLWYSRKYHSSRTEK